MDWLSILAVVIVIAILFLGYYLFLRYSRAKARLLRQPGAVITKIYQDDWQFEEEAKKMFEGGYIISYVSVKGKYLLTEGQSLEQIKNSLKSLRQGEEIFIVNYTK